MEPFGAFFGIKCTPYLEARQKVRSGVKGLTTLTRVPWFAWKSKTSPCHLELHPIFTNFPYFGNRL